MTATDPIPVKKIKFYRTTIIQTLTSTSTKAHKQRNKPFLRTVTRYTLELMNTKIIIN